MPKRGTNIYKRKDDRWEARYIKEILPITIILISPYVFPETT